MQTATVDSDKHTYADYVSSKGRDFIARAHEFRGFLEDWKSRGTYSYHRPLVAAHGSQCRIRDDENNQDRSLIMLSSNSYLGLHTRPEVIEAACAATRRYGSGMGGSRFLCGTYDLVEKLERELADFECKEAAMVFTSGYQANVGAISALLRPGDIALIDRLSHASILDGCAMAGCSTRTFEHNDVADLERLLNKSASSNRNILIITEGVFSMDGDIAPMRLIAQLARAYGARIMLDEAHATGVLGINGRGLAEQLDIESSIDIVVGTLSKTLGGTGGFIASTRDIVDYVRHYGRSYMFSASPCPGVVAGVREALRILRSEPELRSILWRNVSQLYYSLKHCGFRVFPDPMMSAIISLPIGEDVKTRELSKTIYEKGVFASTVVHPAVPPRQGRVRLSISAEHTISEIEAAVKIMHEAAVAHGIIGRQGS